MTAHDRRVILRGLAVVLVALLLTRIAPAQLARVHAARERVEAAQDLLGRQVASWNDRDSVETAIRAGTARLEELQGLLLPVVTEARGVEWLTQRARDVLAAGGARFARLEHVVDSTSGHVRTATLSLEVDADEAALLETLRVFESQEGLVVTSVDVRRTEDSRAGPLHARLVISGYYIPTADEASS